MPEDTLEAFDADRPRGVLTRRERRYLLGESDIEEKTQTERSVRQSIREHLRHTLLDFQIIYQKLDSRDRDELIPGDDSWDIGPLRGGLAAMLAFAYQLDENLEAFEETIEYGIEWAEQEGGWKADVSADLTRERIERLDSILGRAQDEGGDAVDRQDLFALLMTGKISREEWRELRAELYGREE